jgi:hypothetical protein
MRELSAPELLEIWERGSAQSPTERALTLLYAARPDLDHESLASMSIGRRDGLLLSMRETIFGRRLASITNCPDCREQLELGFDTDDVRLTDSISESEESGTLTVEGYELRFRLPDSRDLMMAAVAGDIDSGKQMLMKRCVLSARSNGQQNSIDQLPAEVIERVEQEMSKLDAQANIQVELDCPSCRRSWTATFDILAFFWTELDAWAQRLLAEVDKLASAYGWREADILAMSATRRNIYLNIIAG